MDSQTVAPSQRPRVSFIVSAPMTIEVFLKAHIKALSEDFFIDVICNASQRQLPQIEGAESVRFHHIAIDRSPNLARDLAALTKLIKLLLELKPDVVQSVTPKAGLLGMIAARLAQVPIRVHWVTGQVWANRSGFRRLTLKFIDKLMLSLTTNILVDGPTQMKFLLKQGLVSESNTRVIGSGSIAGVDTDIFRPDPEARRSTRSALSVAKTTLVLCFVGRLKREKGFTDLADALATLDSREDFLLLAVGRDEENLAPRARTVLGSRFMHVDHTNEVQKYLQASDLFVLPSHREGFGLSVIEASSCELPVIVSDIYGLEDAIVPEITGLTCPVMDVPALASTISTLSSEPDTRTRLGSAGRQRALQLFRQDTIVQEYVAFIADLTRSVNPGESA